MRPVNSYEETVPASQEVREQSCPQCGGPFRHEGGFFHCVVCDFRLCQECEGGIEPAE